MSLKCGVVTRKELVCKFGMHCNAFWYITSEATRCGLTFVAEDGQPHYWFYWVEDAGWDEWQIGSYTVGALPTCLRGPAAGQPVWPCSILVPGHVYR